MTELRIDAGEPIESLTTFCPPRILHDPQTLFASVLHFVLFRLLAATLCVARLTACGCQQQLFERHRWIASARGKHDTVRIPKRELGTV
jgi:hypothetical protein